MIDRWRSGWVRDLSHERGRANVARLLAEQAMRAKRGLTLNPGE